MATAYIYPDKIYIDDSRYNDDLTRERTIYANGQYYRIKEGMFSGGPFAVPTYIWDPYGPWQMAKPWKTPQHFWNDLNYKHAQQQKAVINNVLKEYDLRGEVPANEDLLAVPIGTAIDSVKNIVDLTIAFGNKELNYTTPIVTDEVYRIDYYEDATLKSIVGKIKLINIQSGKDYRGNREIYCYIHVDISGTFDNQVPCIDSRTIRYIKNVRDMMNASMIVNRCYVGPTEPENPDEFGLWIDPAIGVVKMRYDGEWKIVGLHKPEEDPGENMYWAFDYGNCIWFPKHIPKKPESIDPKIDFEFDEHDGKWKPVLVIPDEESTNNNSDNTDDLNG